MAPQSLRHILMVPTKFNVRTNVSTTTGRSSLSDHGASTGYWRRLIHLELSCDLHSSPPLSRPLGGFPRNRTHKFASSTTWNPPNSREDKPAGPTNVSLSTTECCLTIGLRNPNQPSGHQLGRDHRSPSFLTLPAPRSPEVLEPHRKDGFPLAKPKLEQSPASTDKSKRGIRCCSCRSFIS